MLRSPVRLSKPSRKKTEYIMPEMNVGRFSLKCRSMKAVFWMRKPPRMTARCLSFLWLDYPSSLQMPSFAFITLSSVSGFSRSFCSSEMSLRPACAYNLSLISRLRGSALCGDPHSSIYTFLAGMYQS